MIVIYDPLDQEMSDGAEMQQGLLDAAGDMPLIGPNCYGFLNYLDGARLISAWCELRNNIRHFRTDRIISINETKTRYPKRRDELIKLWREAESCGGGK